MQGIAKVARFGTQFADTQAPVPEPIEQALAPLGWQLCAGAFTKLNADRARRLAFEFDFSDRPIGNLRV